MPNIGAKEACDAFRYILSTLLTFGSIGLVCYGIGWGYAALPGHPGVLFTILVLVLILLAYLEGLQVWTTQQASYYILQTSMHFMLSIRRLPFWLLSESRQRAFGKIIHAHTAHINSPRQERA
jgi:hypothetical protein